MPINSQGWKILICQTVYAAELWHASGPGGAAASGQKTDQAKGQKILTDNFNRAGSNVV